MLQDGVKRFIHCHCFEAANCTKCTLKACPFASLFSSPLHVLVIIQLVDAQN